METINRTITLLVVNLLSISLIYHISIPGLLEYCMICQFASSIDYEILNYNINILLIIFLQFNPEKVDKLKQFNTTATLMTNETHRGVTIRTLLLQIEIWRCPR